MDRLEEASCYLKKTLDWDHPTDLDLERISDVLGTDWENDYRISLGFTAEEIADLKHDHRFDSIALLR